jgi:hypothetical protein
MSAAEVMGEGWRRVMSLPKKENPAFGHDRCQTMGQSGQILAALGDEWPITCTVKEGTAVFVIGIMSFCGSWDDIFTRQEQIDCTLPDQQHTTSISLTIDGGAPIDLHTQQYLACSPQRDVTFLKGNAFDVSPGSYTFTACGWVAMLKDLPVGTHHLRSLANFTDGSTHLWAPDIAVAPAH